VVGRSVRAGSAVWDAVWAAVGGTNESSVRAAILAICRPSSAIAVLAEVAVVARPLFSVVGRGGERNLSRRLALGRGTTQQGAGSSKDSGGFGAHPKNPAAAGGQDLEVELIETDAELLSSSAEGFLDRLPGEFVISVAKGCHVSVVSLVDLYAVGC
jgi:hypothetical protein